MFNDRREPTQQEIDNMNADQRYRWNVARVGGCPSHTDDLPPIPNEDRRGADQLTLHEQYMDKVRRVRGW